MDSGTTGMRDMNCIKYEIDYLIKNFDSDLDKRFLTGRDH